MDCFVFVAEISVPYATGPSFFEKKKLTNTTCTLTFIGLFPLVDGVNSRFFVPSFTWIIFQQLFDVDGTKIVHVTQWSVRI